MPRKKSPVQNLALSILFIGVAIAVYFEKIPRLVDFIGVLACGMAAGVFLSRFIISLKRNK